MSNVTKKVEHALRRQSRVRSVVTGTADRPRLSVHISNYNVSAQLIDDVSKKTIVSSTSSAKSKDSLSVKAEAVGTDIAKKAKTKKIKSIAFDRGRKLYHGRVKQLAEAARKEGLEF